MQMTQTDKYFLDRFNRQEKLVHRKMLERRKELKEIYLDARKEMEADLALFLERYGRANGFTQADTRKMLNTEELARFRYSIKGYLDEIDRLGIDTPEGAALRKELDILAGRTRVARIKELQTAIDTELKLAALKAEQKTGMHMREIASYVHEDGKKIFKTNTLAKLSPKRIERIVMQNWSGGNYSTSIWDNTDYLAKRLRKNIITGVIQGHEFKRMSDKLALDMDVGYFQARRILETETTYALESSKTELFKDLGLDEYKNCATIDDRTSDICRKMNGTVYKLSEKKEGVTCAPFHPFCRTVSIPVVNRRKWRQLQLKYK